MQDDNKNLFLAIALSMAVLVGWGLLAPPSEELPQDAAQTELAPAGVAAPPNADAGAVFAQPSNLAAPEPGAVLEIATARMSGSISLKGGLIDNLHLSDYTVALDSDETVTLLSPEGSSHPYYVLHGWAPTAGISFDAVPGPNTPWQVESGEILTETKPITLRWDNGAGLIFRRTIAVDENYMFDITQSVENQTETAVRLAPYGIIARVGEPETQNFFVLHEGVVRAHDGTQKEISYSKMVDLDVDAAERAAIDKVSVEENGWIGFTDKYWMSALVPQAGQGFTSVVKYTQSNDTYQVDMRLPTQDIAANSTLNVISSLFAGAKEVATIKAYQEDRQIELFEDAIDWGWFFFLTKPIFSLLTFVQSFIGNMGWSIIVLTLIIKAALFPLAYKSYVSMSKMKLLQPKMQELKERAGDDKMKLQTEMMALYKKEKVNPAAGCLPILLQIPIFFSLYKVLFVTIEMYHAPFIWWIRDLSAPDPTSILNLFGVLPFDAPDPTSLLAYLSIGVFPILMGVTMWLQQKLNPAPTDEIQARIFAWMPWVFMFMLGRFASGLVIYWVANNTITFVQQYAIMRSQGVKVDILGNIKGGFKRKKEKA